MKRPIVSICLVLAVLAGTATAVIAQQEVRGVHLRQQGLKVIDEKCLVCHNRQRIEDAVQQRKDMERITRLMEKKGAALTENERQVMNHFWRKKLFKSKAESGPSGKQGGVSSP
jgi:Tfp pilus assembly protein PilN